MARSRRLMLDIGQGLSVMIGFPTIASWKSKDRPKDAKPGTLGFNTQTGTLEYWNGNDWLAAKMEEG